MKALWGIGDANRDGRIDFSDYLVLSQHYGETNSAAEYVDFNGDGMVNFSDYLILSRNFGTSGGSGEKNRVADGIVAEPVGEEMLASWTMPCTAMGLVMMTGISCGIIGMGKRE
jgi:hypothetical protein